MAVLGVQLVLSMVMASFLSKFCPQMSFARWLLCGRLVRFLHPTDEELRSLINAGSHRKPRKDHQKFHKSSAETLNILKSTPIQLDSEPIQATDVLSLRYYSDYQWLLDFALFSSITYLLTEIYYLFVKPVNEFNLSMIWCLLIVGFCIKILFSLSAIYFSTDENGERMLCILFGFFFLIVAMAVLIVDERILEFGLVDAYHSFLKGAEECLKTDGLDSTGPASLLTFKIILAFCSAVLGAFLTFPGIRLAKMHNDSLKYSVGNPLKALCLYTNILGPLVLALLWVRPVLKSYLVDKTYRGMLNVTLDSNTFDMMRVLLVLVFCAFRFSLCWTHFQAHLNMAYEKVESLKKEAGRITSTELQKMIASVYYYLCVIALQYLAPLLLLLFTTLMLKTLGDFSLTQTFNIPVPNLFSTSLTNSTTQRSVVADVLRTLPPGSADQTVNHISNAVNSLHVVFSPVFFRGVLTYFCWWICVAWFSTSAFGLLYYSYIVD